MAIILIFYVKFENKWYGQIALVLFGSLSASFIYFLFTSNNNNVFPIYKYICYFYSNIRLSISYLMRINIDGKFLLIWNEKRATFTPIGGVYKYYEEGKGVLNQLDYES